MSQLRGGGKKQYFQLCARSFPFVFMLRSKHRFVNPQATAVAAQWEFRPQSPKEGAGWLSFCNRIWGRTAAVLGEQGKASGGSDD